MAARAVVEPVGAVEVTNDPAIGPVFQDGVPPRDLAMINRDRLDIVSTNGVSVEAMEALVFNPDDDG